MINKRFLNIAFITALLCSSQYSHAQNKALSGIIFEDDFSKDVTGQFPAHWTVKSDSDRFNNRSNEYDSESYKKKLITVQKEGNKYCLSAEQQKGGCTGLAPNVVINKTDSLKIEFDYFFKNEQSGITIELCHDTASRACYEVFLFITTGIANTVLLETSSWSDAYFKNKKATVPLASVGRWHHFIISFNEGDIKCFVDNRRAFNISQTGFFPARFFLCLPGIVKLADFRITSRDADYHISNLLTDNKLVTQAIHFEVNASSIKPESMGFIKQLTDLLKTNPKVKLEIAGHTDSDGGAATNMVLSFKRAEAISKQLVLCGIEAARLTPKGYGDTRPLQPNTNDENKAINRRVEFVRLAQ